MSAPPPLRVLPLFFRPGDQEEPSSEEKQGLMRHASWARDRYRTLLGGITFALQDEVVVVPGRHPLLAYRPLPEDGVPHYLREIFDHFNTDRESCPFVFVIVLVNPCENWPPGGGRPFNGGYDRGGGLVILSSWFLAHAPIVQSTLQHELGHAFGLPHVDVYGHPLEQGPSLMSYNKAHWSRGFEPSETPGGLIPEDRRGLALNRRAFPGLTFDPRRDVPEGYRLAKVVELGPMTMARDDPPTVSPGSQGYELFLGGVRAGHAPDWTRDQALENLEWNRRNKPGVQVEGRFCGKRLD